MAGPPQWKEHPGFVGVVPKDQRTGLRRSRLRPVGRRGSQRSSAWKKVIATLKKRTSRCEACDVHHLPDCGGRYEQTHHILPRSAGGHDSIDNALPVSAVHHRWIHEHPDLAYKLGLLKKRGAA